MDTPNQRTSSAHVACSRAGTWAAWAEVVRRLGVSNLEKIIFLESSRKIVLNIYRPAQSDEIFLKVGTPIEHAVEFQDFSVTHITFYVKSILENLKVLKWQFSVTLVLLF